MKQYFLNVKQFHGSKKELKSKVIDEYKELLQAFDNSDFDNTIEETLDIIQVSESYFNSNCTIKSPLDEYYFDYNSRKEKITVSECKLNIKNTINEILAAKEDQEFLFTFLFSTIQLQCKELFFALVNEEDKREYYLEKHRDKILSRVKKYGWQVIE
jgi:hypothetical protein